MESFTVRGLTFTYPEQTRKALDGLSFSVKQGELVALVGPSGCGKSTLLRHFKTVLAPHGALSGEILFEGQPLAAIPQREQSARIGFVMQNPDNQLVTDKVWHELAFGLESLGCDTPAIRGRVAEMTSFFGIQSWFYKDVTELSGGQKQLLNLASIMAMQPSVLILDEPTSQLDPIAAADFLATVGKINRELGTSVIITEHRLEEVLPMCDRVLVMDEGRLLCEGSPQAVGERLKAAGHAMFLSMPAPTRIYAAVPNDQQCPITVRDGRLWLDEFARRHEIHAPEAGTEKAGPEPGAVPAVEMTDVWFKYGKDTPDVLRGLSFKAYRGELLAILGGNGTGKTTALSLVSGVSRPYRGKVLLEGTPLAGRESGLFEGLLGVLPQNPQALFVKNNVREDLLEMLKGSRLPGEEKERRIRRVSRLCRLDALLSRHPYDLSGGEQQRAALAKVLLSEPRILLLDEPTKGLDAEFKQVFAEILKSLLRRGVAIVMVSHDIEFCAEYAHRCALFFDGGIVTDGPPRAFFSGNSFYTTSANRMARHLLAGAVTAEDVIVACGGTVPCPPPLPPEDGDMPPLNEGRPVEDAPARLPLWRKLLAGAAGAVALAAAYISLREPDIPWLFSGGRLGLYAVLIGALLLLAAAVGQKSGRPIENEQIPVGKRRLSKRTLAAAVMIVLAIPLTIYIGIYYFGDRKYYFISLLILLETMLPFFLVFEGRKPQARELIVISVLCAIGVAGRAAFFMLPQFKPVAALVIISGVAFGGETGFLVGAVTMLASNVLFGQGPWTPWQMFAMGVIGFLAGVLFRKGVLRRSRLPLCIFGGLAAIAIYGGVMNPSYVVLYNAHPTWPMFLSAYLMGFPFDLIHAAATAIFLWLASRPMLEKLDRIKVKYGLVEARAEADSPPEEAPPAKTSPVYQAKHAR
ncbi:energy-coupling factor transport system ATP-binding protein [Sporobacter termitidis DSM 10068]|uniref:Energy-coupling factor transport system ATP-binding protein n=1 Tax=Sporobacter termitidis DSM 10068 TaxID=1123282 RepID=A0A1M5XHX8_9FIRM|nr:ECF transporter S component [Sporobacter termitidis]SHH98863.1 energy-coupling factor transport system ATP-binding protein [Sporobacter termitidis DSM 10068]